MDELERRARLAKRVRELRDARVLTQEDLAEASKVGRATIARIELATTSARAATIRKLAAALDVRPTDLVDDNPRGLW